MSQTTVPYAEIKTGTTVSKLPLIGIGTWKMKNAVEHVKDAIEVGYRHIDGAMIYGNEVEVGTAINEAINEKMVKREDLFVVSKLWNTDHKKENVKKAFERSLADLKLEYLDMYLMHFPLAFKHISNDELIKGAFPTDVDFVPIRETWEAMEELILEGKVRHIGVSNFSIGQLRDLLSYCKVKPVVNQVEVHPYLSQKRLIEFCDYYNIHVTAYSPLGVLSYIPMKWGEEKDSILKDTEMIEMAKRLNKTIPQVILRWGVQRQTSIIPKCSSKERMIENFKCVEFDLQEEDMKKIDSLNKNLRFNIGRFTSNPSTYLWD